MLNAHKLGLAVGSVLGLSHLGWSILVAIGAAQWLLDWIFRLHFIQPPYKIDAFSVSYAIALILLTSITGYVTGWWLGSIWNWLYTPAAPGVRAWTEQNV